MLNSSTLPTLTYVKLGRHISLGHYQTMKTMIVEGQICNKTILDNRKIHIYKSYMKFKYILSIDHKLVQPSNLSKTLSRENE